MEVATYMPYQHRAFQPSYNPHYAQYQDPRAHTSNPVSTEPSLASHYAFETARRNERAMHATIAHGSHTSEEANKPSLPSISNLLGIAADGERTSVSHQDAVTSVPQQQTQQAYYSPAQPDMSAMPTYSTTLDSTMPQRTNIAPTPPPLRSDSVVDPANSPSVVSQSSISAPSYFLGSSLNNMEPHQQRVASIVKRHSVPMQQGAPLYSTSPYAIPQYNSSPGALSASSYYSSDGVYPVNALYHQQRPLPSNFPPGIPAPIVTTSNLPTPNLWEHHHYINPSSHTPYPQSQDRYICGTCHKAFSRPSSLKIHSHSHTGEKPFKCPHPGCGKAFSVRSNMKRHERGCHTGSSSIMGGV